jgi:hypothetical protein
MAGWASLGLAVGRMVWGGVTQEPTHTFVGYARAAPFSFLARQWAHFPSGPTSHPPTVLPTGQLGQAGGSTYLGWCRRPQPPHPPGAHHDRQHGRRGLHVHQRLLQDHCTSSGARESPCVPMLRRAWDVCRVLEAPGVVAVVGYRSLARTRACVCCLRFRRQSTEQGSPGFALRGWQVGHGAFVASVVFLELRVPPACTTL